MDRHVKENPLIRKEVIRFVEQNNTQQYTQGQMLLKFVSILKHVIHHVDNTEIDPGNVNRLPYASVYIVSPMIQRGHTQDPH